MTYAEKRRRSLLASLIWTARSLERAHPEHIPSFGCPMCRAIDRSRTVIRDERRALSSDLWRSRRALRRAV